MSENDINTIVDMFILDISDNCNLKCLCGNDFESIKNLNKNSFYSISSVYDFVVTFDHNNTYFIMADDSSSGNTYGLSILLKIEINKSTDVKKHLQGLQQRLENLGYEMGGDIFEQNHSIIYILKINKIQSIKESIEGDWVNNQITEEEWLKFSRERNPQELSKSEIKILDNLISSIFNEPIKSFIDGSNIQLTTGIKTFKTYIFDLPNRESIKVDKFEDEWFLVYFCGTDYYNDKFWICDGIEGIKTLTKEIIYE